MQLNIPYVRRPLTATFPVSVKLRGVAPKKARRMSVTPRFPIVDRKRNRLVKGKRCASALFRNGDAGLLRVHQRRRSRLGAKDLVNTLHRDAELSGDLVESVPCPTPRGDCGVAVTFLRFCERQRRGRYQYVLI